MARLLQVRPFSRGGALSSQHVCRGVVGLDFSEGGDAALVHAFELSTGEAAAELHVVHVTEAEAGGAALDPELSWHQCDAALAATSERLRRHVEGVLDSIRKRPCCERVTLHVRVGLPADGIARLAAEIDADMVVIGARGQGARRRPLLGSVAEQTVRSAGCPVLVVRPKDHGERAEGVSRRDREPVMVEPSTPS